MAFWPFPYTQRTKAWGENVYRPCHANRLLTLGKVETGRVSLMIGETSV
jgi:hypothetical protein